MSYPYTLEQNGLAERKHRHIVETTITLLQTANLPHKLWFHVCATSIYLINRLPCKILQLKSLFFLLYGSSPVIHHLCIFGCACFPLLRPYNTHKLQPKTPPAFSWGMQVNIRDMFVFHFAITNVLLLVMLFFMSPSFHTSLSLQLLLLLIYLLLFHLLSHYTMRFCLSTLLPHPQ